MCLLCIDGEHSPELPILVSVRLAVYADGCEAARAAEMGIRAPVAACSVYEGLISVICSGIVVFRPLLTWDSIRHVAIICAFCLVPILLFIC